MIEFMYGVGGVFIVILILAYLLYTQFVVGRIGDRMDCRPSR